MVTTYTQESIKPLEMTLLIAGSALFNGAIIASVLLVLDGGTLTLIEGGLVPNLIAIYAMAFLFSWLFLRSEQRKAAFAEMTLESHQVIIKRRLKTDIIPLESLIFIHADQHFYRLIKRHRITFLHRQNNRKRLATMIVTHEQKNTLYYAIKGSAYENYSRIKEPK